MAGRQVEVLIELMDRVGPRLERRLAGLSDEEFFWEPVDGSWTVHMRRGEDRIWAPGVLRFVNGKGDWVVDYAIPDPDPFPFTTIAWRLVHIGHISWMYHEHVFGPGRLDFDDFEIPHTAVDAGRWWEEGFARHRATVKGLTDADLGRRVEVPWGPSLTVREWCEVLIDETIHHGAEIGCLRDLFRHTRSTGGVI